MQRTILHRTDSFEIVSIQWDQSTENEPHFHGWSQCMVLVEEGVFENTLQLGPKSETQVYEVGQVMSTPVGASHQMKCLTKTGKTLHVYSPKMNEIADADKFLIDLSSPTVSQSLGLKEATRMDALKEVLKTIQANSVSTHSPYFMNQLFSGVMPQMLMAEEVIARTRTTMATYEASPILSKIEGHVISALCDLIGWDSKNQDGVSVPGGSAANFMAIHCARQAKFPQFKKSGMNGTKLAVFVSSEAHYSFKKACVALGIGTDNLIPVPVNAKGEMNAEKLDELIGQTQSTGVTPLIVCATAGTTVLGAFDPIDEISKVCKKHQVWLHVDGAWGGPALFSQKTRGLVRGIEQADSFTFDAHKLFGAGLTCSFLLTQHKGLLLEANDVSGGDYLFHSDDPNLDRGKATWQCGRRADALSFWAIWKSLGTEGLGQFVDHLLQVKQEVTSWIHDQPRLELVGDAPYLNICVRVQSHLGAQENADWSKQVRESLKDNNLAFVNFSADEKGPFLRLILAHPFLQTTHVKQILEWALAVEAK
jgi:glutamate/tyrosine decarboxylase-like PLP-dependent enzyme/quercetin dioxygenase-like cupin family protein